jgi:hypothetical protein
MNEAVFDPQHHNKQTNKSNSYKLKEKDDNLKNKKHSRNLNRSWGLWYKALGYRRGTA